MSSETTWTLEQVHDAAVPGVIDEEIWADLRDALLAARRSQPAPEAVQVDAGCERGCGVAHGPPRREVMGCFDGGLWFCTSQCRDRAKAKAGEQACVCPFPRTDCPGCEHACPACTAAYNKAAEQPAAPPWSDTARKRLLGHIADPPAPVAEPTCCVCGATSATYEDGDGKVYCRPCARGGRRDVAPAVPQPAVPMGWTSGVVTCLSYLNHRCAHPACVKAAMTKEGQEEAKRLARVLADATPIGAPATSAAVQGGISTEPFNRWMHAVGRRLERADLPLASFLAGQAALEAVNAELRVQAVKAEQFFADHTAAHERQLTGLRADNDRLSREVVRLGNERDARDARIAGLEASAADLVRRAQEAETKLAESDRSRAEYQKMADEFQDKHVAALARLGEFVENNEKQAALVAELRGKLAAAERAGRAVGARACYAHFITEDCIPDGTQDYDDGSNQTLSPVLDALEITWDDFNKASGAPALEVG